MRISNVVFSCSLFSVLLVVVLSSCVSVPKGTLTDEILTSYLHEHPSYVFSFNPSADANLYPKLADLFPFVVPDELLSRIDNIFGSVEDTELRVLVEHHIPLGIFRNELRKMKFQHRGDELWTEASDTFSLQFLRRKVFKLDVPAQFRSTAPVLSRARDIRLVDQEIVLSVILFDTSQVGGLAAFAEQVEVLFYADRRISARIAPRQNSLLPFLLTTLRLAGVVPLLPGGVELPIEEALEEDDSIRVDTQHLSEQDYLRILRSMLSLVQENS